MAVVGRSLTSGSESASAFARAADLLQLQLQHQHQHYQRQAATKSPGIGVRERAQIGASMSSDDEGVFASSSNHTAVVAAAGTTQPAFAQRSVSGDEEGAELAGRGTPAPAGLVGRTGTVISTGVLLKRYVGL